MTIGGRCPAIGCCLLLLIMAAGCAGSQRQEDPMAGYDVQQLMDLGEKFLVAGDTGQALRYLVAAEKKLPNDPVIQYDLGLAYDARQIPDKALEHFHRALQLKPDYAEAQNALGAFYAQQGHPDEALRYFQMALENPFYRTPQYVYFNMGRIYEQQNDLETALQQYRRAVQIRANYTPAIYQMGKVLEALNRTEKARQAYAEAIHYNPDHVPAQFAYGRLCLKTGRLNQAINAFQSVLDLAPRSELANQARTYLQSAMDRM